jgi:replicative DNA helicase
MFELAKAGNENRSASIEDLVVQETQAFEQNYPSKTPSGLSTGYPDLNRLFTLRPTDLIILAARPSMGKTALALNISYRVAKNLGEPVCFFSLEMSREQLTRRLMSAEGQIDHDRINKVAMNGSEWASLYEVRRKVEGVPLEIDDSAGLSVMDIRARARQRKAQGKLSMVVVDYLQLIRPTRRFRSRQEEIAEASRGFKMLAKELEIPVLILAQLNRECEKRPDKRPVLSDLRESGAIEQDADAVIFIYRDEVYNEDSKCKGVAEIRFAKQRNGKIGKVKLAFREDIVRFDSLARQA